MCYSTGRSDGLNSIRYADRCYRWSLVGEVYYCISHWNIFITYILLKRVLVASIYITYNIYILSIYIFTSWLHRYNIISLSNTHHTHIKHIKIYYRILFRPYTMRYSRWNRYPAIYHSYISGEWILWRNGNVFVISE